jgi:hypothetical protein
MSIELGALVRIAVPLVDVLAHAEATIAKLSRPPAMAPLVVDPAPSADFVIGPFPLPKRDVPPGRYPPDVTLWSSGTLDISSGPISKVGLTLAHVLTHEERGLPPIPPTLQTEQHRLESAELAGYRAMIGVYRTKHSFCLAALLVHSIATLNRSRIIDDEGRLKRGDLVDPAAVAELLAKHGDAETFEQLADRFCAELGFGAGWPDAAAALAALDREQSGQ